MGWQVGREERKWKESTEEELIREETNLKPQQLCPRRNRENTVEVLGENFPRDKVFPGSSAERYQTQQHPSQGLAC